MFEWLNGSNRPRYGVGDVAVDGHDSTGGASAVDELKGTTFTRIAAVTFSQEDNRGT